MDNFVHNGDAVTFTAPAALASGQGVLIQNTFMVAVAAYTSGQTGCIGYVKGVYTLPKDAVAITAFTLAYWDASGDSGAGAVTNTSNSGANKLIGVFENAQLAGDPTAQVRLNGAFIS